MEQVDRLYEGQGFRMSKLLSKYSDAEFSAIADFLEQTTTVLTEEGKKLRKDSWQPSDAPEKAKTQVLR